MTKIVMTRGSEEEILEIEYKSAAEVTIQKINSEILKFSLDYRQTARATIYAAICLFLFILLMEIGGIYNGLYTIPVIIIFDSVYIISSFIIWLYIKFNINEFIFDKKNNTLTKIKPYFCFKRQFGYNLDDIHFIDCERRWYGNAYHITFCLKNSNKKIYFYGTSDREEILDYCRELENFLNVKTEFSTMDGRGSWN